MPQYTRTETVLGLCLFAGALVLVGRCVVGREAPAAETWIETCAASERAQSHVTDQEFDLERGIRTGSMSASDVRQQKSTLEARRRIAAEKRAACEAAQAGPNESAPKPAAQR
jgi:hypothetical protein